MTNHNNACPKCGAANPDSNNFCQKCGAPLNGIPLVQQDLSSGKSRLVAFLLCLFFGVLGIHPFYVGKIGTGIIWILTVGVFGIGTIIDFIMIICGLFKDKDGLCLKKWTD